MEVLEQDELQQEQQQDPPGSKAKKLYNNLLSEGYTIKNLGSEDEFTKALADPVKSQKIYDGLINDGYTESNLGKRDAFLKSFTKVDEHEQRKSFMQTNPLSPLSALKKKQEVLPTPQERKAKETHAEDYPLNPMATIKRQTIKVGSETLPIETTFPGVKADEKLAKEIQHRVETGTTTVEDARIVGNAMNISPLAANAILNGKINTGTAINIAEKKAEFSGKIKGLVEEANKALGLNDDYEQVTKNPQTVKAYLEKLEKGYAAKKQREIGRLDKAYERDFDRIRSMGEMSAGDLPVGYTEAIQDISDANQNAYEALKGIFGSLLVQQINSDPKLSREQKVATIRTTLNPVKSKITDEVINERLSPFKYVKQEAMRYMFPWMKTTNEEIAPLEADKAQIELALTNDDKNNLFSANTQLGAIAENLQDKKDKGEQLTNEEAKVLQSAATALQQRIATIEAGFVPEKEIFKKYPILLQQKVVQLVNDYNALKSGNIEGRGKMYENTTLEEHLAANDIDPNDQRIKDILANAPIKDYGSFGRPLTAAKNVILDAFSSIANLTGITDDMTALSSKAMGELFPTEPGKNDEYRLKGGARTMHTIASTTGQVIGQGVLQLATAGAGKIAGLAPAVARNAAFATSGFLTQYDNSYKESFNFIESKVGRMVYAAANAGFSAAAEKMFPDMDVLKVPGTKEALVKIAQRVGTKDFTQAALKESLNDVGKTIIAFGKKYSKTTEQEVSEEDLTSLFHDVSNFVAGDKEMNVSAAIENLKETTIQTALGMSAIAGFSAVKDIRTERNVSPRLDLYNAALYHDAATDAINKGFADGKYSEAERDEKLSILTTAVQSLGALKKAEQAANTVLSRGKRGVYVSNLTAETILNKQIEANKNSPVPDAVLNEQLKSKVAALKEQRTQLLTDPTIDIEDDGDVVDLGEQKPYYKIDGKDVSKAELLEAMSKPFDRDMEFEAGNDAEIQERLEKIGGKTESLSNETTTTYIPKAGVSSNSNEGNSALRDVTEEQKMQFGKGYKDFNFTKQNIPTDKIKITEQPSLSERKDLIADIKQNGIKEPIIVQYDKESDSYFVKNGNNRAQIAKDLGLKEVPTIVAEFKEPNETTPTKEVNTPVSTDESKPKEAGVSPNSNEAILNSINPTGSIFADYKPEDRMKAKLAGNITTLDKTEGGNADDVITIYRGVPNSAKEITGGDFVTTNKQLAKDYAGTGKVIEKKVRKGDLLDDKTEPLGEEYIYRPNADKEGISSNSNEDFKSKKPEAPVLNPNNTKTETVKQTVSKKQGDRTVSHEVDAVKITYTDENGFTYEATAPIQFTQEQATKVAESEIIAKVADQKANREAKTEYEDKNGNRVIQSNDGWKVVNTEGKEVSATTARKVHTKRLESFDFTKGEDGVAPDAGSDQKAIDREMIATSTNPVQLLDIYERNIEQPSLSTAETIIADHGIGKISKESFEEFSDSNNITMSLARTYFAPKDSKIKPQTLDQVAHELSEDSGIEITPEDVANFMVRFPNGMTSDAKPNDVAGEAAIRFEQVTGFKLDNPANNKRTGIENVVREQQQKKEDEKLTKEEEDLLNLTLKQAEESKQATDEFWAHLADPANEQARKEFLYGRETTEQSEESGQEGTGESTVTQNNPEAEKEEADGSPDKNTDADTEPTARTQEAKGRTVEQKNVQKQLDAANEEYRIAKDAFTAKRKELDETIQSDQEDLFGERKSKNDKSLFDERVDPAAKDKALAPLKARMDKAKAETERLAKNLADLEGKPSAQMDIGDAAKENATKNNVEEFNKKVDDVADKLIDLLIPKHLRGTSAKGASAESVIRSAAAIIKTAYRLGHDTKVAIQDAIDFIEKNWDAKWGVFDKAATESMMAANFDSYKTKVDVVPQTGSAAKLSEKKFDNALTRSKGNTDSVFKRIKNFFSNLSYWLDNPNRYITEFEKNIYNHYDTKPTSKISLGRVFEQRATGRASYEVRKFVNTVIKGLSKKDIAEFEKYIAAKRVKDRLEQEALNKTFTDSENSRATGNITLQDAVNTIAAMSERLGKDKIKDFERRAAEFQDRMDEALQERVRTGLLSQEDYDKIKSENEFYAPFAVMGHGERYSDGREAALPSTTVGRVQGISYKDGVFSSSPIKAAQAALKKGNITQEQFFNIAIAYLDQQLSTGAISTETYAKEFGALSASGFVIDNIFNKASSLIFNSYTAGHKNELMQRLGDVAKLDKDGVFVKKIDGYDLREIDGQKMMIPKKLSDIKVEEGFGVVGYKDNGKQVFLSINRNTANTINGLDVSEIKGWMKAVNFFNAVFRTSVITLGAAFQAGNLALDIVRNSTLSKYGVFAGKNIQDSITNAILFVPQYMEGLISSGKANLFGKHDELYTEFLKSKGFSSGLYDDLFLNKKKELRSVEPESFFNKLKYGGIDKLFKFIEGIGTTFEQTHKLVTFERGMDVENGIRFGISKWKNLISNAKTPHDMTNALDQVAFEVQNYAGSPNFAATHSGIKTMGVLFQFISARLKGEMADYRRIATLFGGGIDGAKLSKGERAKITAQLATIITPIIYYAIKNNGDDEEEEYMTNSAYDRNNNILIKSGKFEYKNKDGETETHTDYIKIPLRGLTSTMMVTANAFAQFLKKKNPDEFKKAATISLMNTLPVNIDGDTPDERLESATVGSFTSIPKFLVETAANRNSFTHSDLIYGDYNYGKGSMLQAYNAGKLKPYEVVRYDTPQWAVDMSKFIYEKMGIGWTAVGIDHFENTILGNATNQIKPNVVSRKFLRSESTYPVRRGGK